MIKVMSEVWTELEKIDILRERMGLTYDEARVALEEAQGDVIKALANKETEMGFEFGEEGARSQLWGGLKHQMQRLSQTQVNLKRRDKTVLSVSAPVGIAMAYALWRRPALRMLGLLGAAGAAMKHYHLEVDSAGEDVEYKQYSFTDDQPVSYSETDVSSGATMSDLQ
jgi:hypothetical protein